MQHTAGAPVDTEDRAQRMRPDLPSRRQPEALLVAVQWTVLAQRSASGGGQGAQQAHAARAVAWWAARGPAMR